MMIILHFHLQPQFKNELFHIYFTSYCTHFVQLSVLVLIQLLERLLSGPEVLVRSVYSLHCNDQEMKTSSISLRSRYLRPKGFSKSRPQASTNNREFKMRLRRRQRERQKEIG